MDDAVTEALLWVPLQPRSSRTVPLAMLKDALETSSRTSSEYGTPPSSPNQSSPVLADVFHNHETANLRDLNHRLGPSGSQKSIQLQQTECILDEELLPMSRAVLLNKEKSERVLSSPTECTTKALGAKPVSPPSTPNTSSSSAGSGCDSPMTPVDETRLPTFRPSTIKLASERAKSGGISIRGRSLKAASHSGRGVPRRSLAAYTARANRQLSTQHVQQVNGTIDAPHHEAFRSPYEQSGRYDESPAYHSRLQTTVSSPESRLPAVKPMINTRFARDTSSILDDHDGESCSLSPVLKPGHAKIERNNSPNPSLGNAHDILTEASSSRKPSHNTQHIYMNNGIDTRTSSQMSVSGSPTAFDEQDEPVAKSMSPIHNIMDDPLDEAEEALAGALQMLNLLGDGKDDGTTEQSYGSRQPSKQSEHKQKRQSNTDIGRGDEMASLSLDDEANSLDAVEETLNQALRMLNAYGNLGEDIDQSVEEAKDNSQAAMATPLSNSKQFPESDSTPHRRPRNMKSQTRVLSQALPDDQLPTSPTSSQSSGRAGLADSSEVSDAGVSSSTLSEKSGTHKIALSGQPRSSGNSITSSPPPATSAAASPHSTIPPKGQSRLYPSFSLDNTFGESGRVGGYVPPRLTNISSLQTPPKVQSAAPQAPSSTAIAASLPPPILPNKSTPQEEAAKPLTIPEETSLPETAEPSVPIAARPPRKWKTFETEETLQSKVKKEVEAKKVESKLNIEYEPLPADLAARASDWPEAGGSTVPLISSKAMSQILSSDGATVHTKVVDQESPQSGTDGAANSIEPEETVSPADPEVILPPALSPKPLQPDAGSEAMDRIFRGPSPTPSRTSNSNKQASFRSNTKMSVQSGRSGPRRAWKSFQNNAEPARQPVYYDTHNYGSQDSHTADSWESNTSFDTAKEQRKKDDGWKGPDHLLSYEDYQKRLYLQPEDKGLVPSLSTNAAPVKKAPLNDIDLFDEWLQEPSPVKSVGATSKQKSDLDLFDDYLNE